MEPNAQDLASFVAQLGGGDIAMGGVGDSRQGMDNERSLGPAELAPFDISGSGGAGAADSIQSGKGGAPVSFGGAASQPLSATSPIVDSKKRTKNDRKETMKLYMRNYRKRQKHQMELMPEAEKEKILQKQRQRVRMRVRRHRLRKKLRASGMPAAEIEQKLQEVVPSVTSNNVLSSSTSTSTCSPSGGRGITVTGLPLPDIDRSMNGICLDLPKSQQMNVHDMNLRQQLPTNAINMLGAANGFQVDPAVMAHFRRCLPLQNNVSKLDFGSASHNFTGQDVGAYDNATSSQVKLSPRRWSVSQVGIFLEGLELGHLRAPFERHGVDGQALLDMTPQSLLEMNIVPANSRNELLSAIVSLKKVACVN